MASTFARPDNMRLLAVRNRQGSSLRQKTLRLGRPETPHKARHHLNFYPNDQKGINYKQRWTDSISALRVTDVKLKPCNQILILTA
ncbi:hypothetical protein NPIL_74721 [Nephila pilipes]|uniref:Uncharacterized protein n=1 Tax=Nephila pilipes TaxID=299642 RepID=A0A8X6NM42_NEPPI|nr:hypothetical protein NPIL_74721 [Nephila pilipes]